MGARTNSYQLKADNHSSRDPEDRVGSKAEFIELQQFRIELVREGVRERRSASEVKEHGVRENRVSAPLVL